MGGGLLRVGAFILVLAGCGRLGPGAPHTPPPDSSPSSSELKQPPRRPNEKPVFDDKGCSNATGESGSKMQANCRAGK